METQTLKSKNVPIDGNPFRDKIELSKFDGIAPNLQENFKKEHEKDLLRYGIKNPFDVYITGTSPAKYFLMDGHSDFRFALENELSFMVLLKKFPSEEDVIEYIIRNNIFRLNLSTFQKGVMVLPYKDILVKIGKENMIKGGQGNPVTEKTNTMEKLSEMIGCSHEILSRIEFIVKKIEKDGEVYRQLENNEISISKVFCELKESSKIIAYFENFNTQLEFAEPQKSAINNGISLLPSIEQRRSRFFINETDKYSIVYIKPPYKLRKSSTTEEFIENLKTMNIWNISYHKFSTLFIQIPTMFLSDTIDIIKEWGFNCVDTLVVSYENSKFKSIYLEHYNDLLLICERKNVGVPKACIRNISEKPTIPNEIVLDIIDSMFDEKLPKVGIFIGNRSGWDTYDFNSENKEMIKFFKKMG